jgi:hypothetical protein
VAFGKEDVLAAAFAWIGGALGTFVLLAQLVGVSESRNVGVSLGSTVAIVGSIVVIVRVRNRWLQRHAPTDLASVFD